MLLWKVKRVLKPVTKTAKSHLPHPRKDITLNAPSLPVKSKQSSSQALAKAVVQRID
jgi:hypothetical protein